MSIFDTEEPLTIDYLKLKGFKWDFFNGKHCYIKSFYIHGYEIYGSYIRIVYFEDYVNVYRYDYNNGFKLIYSKMNPDKSDIDVIVYKYTQN